MAVVVVVTVVVVVVVVVVIVVVVVVVVVVIVVVVATAAAAGFVLGDLGQLGKLSRKTLDWANNIAHRRETRTEEPLFCWETPGRSTNRASESLFLLSSILTNITSLLKKKRDILCQQDSKVFRRRIPHGGRCGGAGGAGGGGGLGGCGGGDGGVGGVGGGCTVYLG